MDYKQISNIDYGKQYQFKITKRHDKLISELQYYLTNICPTFISLYIRDCHSINGELCNPFYMLYFNFDRPRLTIPITVSDDSRLNKESIIPVITEVLKNENRL